MRARKRSRTSERHYSPISSNNEGGWYCRKPCDGPARIYRLTAQGVKFASLANAIADAFPATDEPALLRQAWTIPILAVSCEPRRFIEIKSELMSVTDRALSQSLQNLEAQHRVVRRIDVNAHPLRPIYQAVNQGLHISNAIHQTI